MMENRKPEKVAYLAPVKYSNDMDLLDYAMSIFGITVLKKPLTKKDSIILRSYLLNGYSTSTKEGIKLDLNMNSVALNARNCILQKKGFLRPHPTNQKLKIVNPQLLELREAFLNDKERKMFIVSFEKI